ncbi:MAG TPA: hypothetical protein PLF13_13610 [candidate division Zixibacteria bacterium]|nr:hypothetical protein [candidate division Zixibacteria bacterium]
MKSPSVNKKLLPVLAGMVWSAVGIMLCVVAAHWLTMEETAWIVPVTIGAAVGLVVYRFGFLRLVRKNKIRLLTQATDRERVCLFAFQSWRSYLIIVIMVVMGYGLRHSPISRLYLSPIYLAIGLGLFLSSLHYYSSSTQG